MIDRNVVVEAIAEVRRQRFAATPPSKQDARKLKDREDFLNNALNAIDSGISDESFRRQLEGLNRRIALMKRFWAQTKTGKPKCIWPPERKLALCQRRLLLFVLNAGNRGKS
jgi:hypothetical protein